ncbi:fatty acid desaturase [Streptomyces sp. NPDC001523]|uniref:fatty acid desaturase n=1 Tax=Streptomyces sp. NPDC001523 TaxID=3154383 RepID=UPI003332C25A
MLLALSLIALGVALRLPDHARFARGTPQAADAARLIAIQRSHANDWTPTLLLVGQWIQIAGYWRLASQGPWAAAVAAVGVAVQFRHLQEISHHAVHGVLARTRRTNRLLAEAFAHYPLGLPPEPVRRQRHVRDHHPQATLASDPNLAELAAAGLRPGITGTRFALALVHPLTPQGIRTTSRTLTAGLQPGPGRWDRTAAPIAVLAAAYLTGGWTAALAGALLPRLLLYPLLAWWSLLVEHTWFDPDHRTGTPAETEAGRCLRLYPGNRLLAGLATATWLPYGDLHHYAHSAHPGLRWNYLSALEQHLPAPHFTPAALFLGPHSATRRHHRALTVQARDNEHQAAPRR